MNKGISNPHDKFFKTLLADRDVAIDFLRNFLPDKIKHRIDIESFQYTETSFVSEELQETFSDIVLRCPLKNSEQSVFITILIEHKSYPDKFASVQLLYYLASTYHKQLTANRKIELIVPLIFYHGKRKWVLKSIDELIPSLPDEMKSFVPVFETIFIDLNRFDQTQLDTIHNLFLLATLIAQMKNKEPDVVFIESLTVLSRSNVNENWNLFQAFVVYLLETTQFNDEKIQELFDKIPKPIKNKIMTTYDVILRKGKKEGIEQGIEQGIEKEKIEIIIKGYKKGITIETLADITSLSIEKVRQIIENDLKS